MKKKHVWTTEERILMALPATTGELMVRLGLARSCVHKWLGRLRESGCAHVGARLPTRSKSAARWVAGPAPKVVAPRRDATGDDMVQRWRPFAPIPFQPDPLLLALFHHPPTEPTDA